MDTQYAALDIAAIRPFWKAVLAYGGVRRTARKNAMVDPAGQLPAVWFQQPFVSAADPSLGHIYGRDTGRGRVSRGRS